MRARLAGAVMVLASLGIHLGLTASYREQAAKAADEFRRAREERRLMASRLAQKLRLEDAQRRAGRLPGSEGGLAPARAARLCVVRSLEGSGMTRVRLGVAPVKRSPQAVSVHLTGEGSFEDVVRFSGAIARPGSGLLLRQVEMGTQEERVSLSLEAMGLARP